MGTILTATIIVGCLTVLLYCVKTCMELLNDIFNYFKDGSER